jgi:hypothetical protein
VDFQYTAGQVGFRAGLHWNRTDNPWGVYWTTMEYQGMGLQDSGEGWVDALPAGVVTFNVGTWYNLKLEIAGDYARGYLDDTLMLEGAVSPADITRVGLHIHRANAVFDNFWVQSTPIPEPSTALLLAGGLAGLAAAGRRRSVR